MRQNRSKRAGTWLLGGLLLWALPGWAQTIQNGEVEIHGALPRTTSGAVDVEAIKQTVQAQFARPGVQEVQFRGFTLTEEEQRALFLNSDPNRNVLRQLSASVPSSNGVERNVTFRSNDFRARVGREEGQLRARIEGIDTASLTEAERQSLRAQFDRFRLEGVNDRGDLRGDNRSRGGNDNSGPGSTNSGRGSDNSGPGSANSGPGSVNSGSGRSGRDDVRMAQADDMRQEDRREDRRADRQQDRRANSGGELRGLDRADQVAGERGREGRDNARAAQMDRPARPERAERPQRPERPERPQRPERPEVPERSGRR